MWEGTLVGVDICVWGSICLCQCSLTCGDVCHTYPALACVWMCHCMCGPPIGEDAVWILKVCMPSFLVLFLTTYVSVFLYVWMFLEWMSIIMNVWALHMCWFPSISVIVNLYVSMSWHMCRYASMCVDTLMNVWMTLWCLCVWMTLSVG